MSEWLTKQSFQIDEATAERDALVLPSKSRGAEIRLSDYLTFEKAPNGSNRRWRCTSKAVFFDCILLEVSLNIDDSCAAVWD